MADGLKTTAAAGLIALLGAVGGAGITGWSQVQLGKQEFHSKLIMRALESDSPTARLETLELLVETNLINDSSIREGVLAYMAERAEAPERIPQGRAGGIPGGAGRIQRSGLPARG